MDFDLENPLGNFHDLPCDAVPSLFLIESDHIPPPNYCQSLKASDFDISVRRDVVSLISQVIKHQPQFTFFDKDKSPIFMFQNLVVCFSRGLLVSFSSVVLHLRSGSPLLSYQLLGSLPR